jgi:hypothetical protein
MMMHVLPPVVMSVDGMRADLSGYWHPVCFAAAVR